MSAGAQRQIEPITVFGRGSIGLFKVSGPQPAPAHFDVQSQPQESKTNFRLVGAYTLAMTATADIAKYESLGGLVTTLSYNGRTFHLAAPLSLSVRHEDSWWLHEHDDLKIFAHGATIRDSLNQFALQFDAAWTYIAQEPDEGLTEGAQELKQLLLSLVSHVETD